VNRVTEKILIKNADLITATGRRERGWLLSAEGRIAQMGQGTAPEFAEALVIDAGGRTLLPGFIDLHVHGAVGHEAMDASGDALCSMAQFYAQHGVTAFLPTTWTDSRARIQAALEAVAGVQGPQPQGATILGAYQEGPYLNPAQCGAQSTVHIRRAGRDEALAFLDTGVIRVVAVAPEYEENGWLLDECVRRGITITAAHTGATYDQIRQAVDRGLTQTTHTYNAMTGLHHRAPGTLGAALTLPQIRCELIADNIHVHPAAMQILFAAKGADGVILITDAIRGTAMPDGDYPIDDRIITIKDGAARLPDGTLAGSTLTMDRALYNFMQATGQPLETLWKSASLNAARAIHVAQRKGSLEVGKDADLVLVDEQISVVLTMAEGRIVYRS
jgi:N-acetylglucosamine-6-phosphate deacetylase